MRDAIKYKDRCDRSLIMATPDYRKSASVGVNVEEKVEACNVHCCCSL